MLHFHAGGKGGGSAVHHYVSGSEDDVEVGADVFQRAQLVLEDVLASVKRVAGERVSEAGVAGDRVGEGCRYDGAAVGPDRRNRSHCLYVFVCGVVVVNPDFFAHRPVGRDGAVARV